MARKNEAIKVDTAAGSRSYNRLDMQVSQTLHMAIELYDELNYLLILDYYWNRFIPGFLGSKDVYTNKCLQNYHEMIRRRRCCETVKARL